MKLICNRDFKWLAQFGSAMLVTVSGRNWIKDFQLEVLIREGRLMKKWHMEGIISSANNRRRRLVILNDNRMYLALDGDSLKSARKPVFLRSLKDFAGHVLGRT